MNRKTILTFLFSSILVTNILFFIDEGYYDFRWMKDAGNWVAFIIYCLPTFLIQLIFYHIFLKKYMLPGKILLSMIGGILLGISLVLGFFYMVLS